MNLILSLSKDEAAAPAAGIANQIRQAIRWRLFYQRSAAH
jgi:hypothetical protein